MPGKGSASIALCLLVVATIGVGCHSAPESPYAYPGDRPQGPDRYAGYNYETIATETYTANHPATVLGGPGAGSPPEGVTPWWFARNDGRLNIRDDAGARGHETTRIDIYDRQRVRPGRIHDSYRRTVRSRRTEQLTR